MAAGLLLVLLAGVAYSDNGKQLPAPGDSAPDFTLKDITDKSHTLKDLRGNHVLLLFGHKDLRDENRKWAQAFRDYFTKRPDVRSFMVADMRIPFFVPASVVKRELAKQMNPVPLLLDWKQRVNNLYGIDADRIEIIGVDPGGRIVLREKAAAFKETEFKEILKKLALSPEAPAANATGGSK